MKRLSLTTKILIGAVIVSLVAASIYLWSNRLKVQEVNQPETDNPKKEAVVLIIDDGSGKTDQFELELEKETTVIELLKKSKVALDYTESNLGVFVNSLKGIQNGQDKNTYWLFYLNGQKAVQGAGEATVKPGDKIEWKYEKVSW
jgi:hypothetical protein